MVATIQGKKSGRHDQKLAWDYEKFEKNTNNISWNLKSYYSLMYKNTKIIMKEHNKTLTKKRFED